MMLALVLLLPPDPAELIAGLRSEDAATRLRAVQQVERLGADGAPDEAYLAPLAKLLADADLQTRGLAALALWRHVGAIKDRVPDGVVGPLVLGLRDADTNVVAYCDRVLSALGERALPQLRAASAADQPQAQRLAAMEGCRRLVAIPGCRVPVNALYWALLVDRDATVRERALVLLRLLRAEHTLPPVREVPILVAALRIDDDRYHELAASQLIALGEVTVPALVDLLDDKDVVVQYQASKVLAEVLNRGAITSRKERAKLLRFLARRDLELITGRSLIRPFAAEWIAEKEFTEQLGRTVKSLPAPPEAPEPEDPLLRLASALAGVPRPRELFERLRSEDAAERLRTVRRIERLGAEGSPEVVYVPVLAWLLFDPDPTTCGLAALALEQHVRGYRGAIPRFVRDALFVALNERDEQFVDTCRRALSTIKPTEPVLDDPQLREAALRWSIALRLPDREGQRAAAEIAHRAALSHGPRSPDEVLEALRWGCKNDDPNIRRLCTEGLAACRDRAEHTLCELLDDLSLDAKRCAIKAILLMKASGHPVPYRTELHLRKLLAALQVDLVSGALEALRLPTEEKKP
jgi:HEAT repeat protein